MVTSIDGEVFSDLAIHPGEFLAEELAERGLTQRAFAHRIGRPVQAVNEICRGKKAITADSAVAFERALGISARFWMNLQATYELTLAYQRAGDLSPFASATAPVRA